MCTARESRDLYATPPLLIAYANKSWVLTYVFYVINTVRYSHNAGVWYHIIIQDRVTSPLSIST